MNISKYAALTAMVTIALGGALAPSAGAATMTARAVASPKSLSDCNNTAQRGDAYVGSEGTCSACLQDAARLDSFPGGGIVFQHYCTYNPGLRHYDLHVHQVF
ncbi:hypothetical protein [Streptomyces gilvus]|uniref:hypothetical protein n=1 Tax=Streptomyces gilvus TaxID=2920937 RepID=UPI001F114EF0|nr:hypothetical protein [Streptomyces sp. CME 23]MCH5676250.1 hypothetical protein [Streptomyces sp. CME 23]